LATNPIKDAMQVAQDVMLSLPRQDNHHEKDIVNAAMDQSVDN
jgi:hypothetical protein